MLRPLSCLGYRPGDQAGAPGGWLVEAPPETPPPAGPAIGFDMAGGDPARPQLAPDHLAADPDLLGDIGKGPPLPAQRDDRRDFVVEQRHASGLLCRGQLAAVLRPAWVMGDIGALCQRQFGTLLRAHRAALAAWGLDRSVGHGPGSCCPRCSPAGCRRLASGAVARGRARRARHALRTAVVRERSDPVASEPE